jgi:hypothetical protein
LIVAVKITAVYLPVILSNIRAGDKSAKSTVAIKSVSNQIKNANLASPRISARDEMCEKFALTSIFKRIEPVHTTDDSLAIQRKDANRLMHFANRTVSLVC